MNKIEELESRLIALHTDIEDAQEELDDACRAYGDCQAELLLLLQKQT